MRPFSLKILPVLLIWVFAYPLQAGTGQAETRNIQYSFTIKNTSNKVVPEVVFQTYGPVPETSWQKVLQTDSSYNYRATGDNFGNRILQFTFENLPPFSSKIVRIRSEIQSFENHRGLTSGLSPDNQKHLDSSEIYLLPEPHVESDHPEVIELSKKLQQDDPLATAKAIFDWVAGNIQYSGYRSKPQGALYALQHKNGDCTEYMALFVALCRAAGIPARGIGGYVVKQDKIVKPEDYHNWAEFYHDGTWQLADPQEKKFMEDEQNYIAMRVIGKSSGNFLTDNSRFMVSGNNIKVKMN
jgi:transglutaminase-like putative cysteine protease